MFDFFSLFRPRPAPTPVPIPAPAAPKIVAPAPSVIPADAMTFVEDEEDGSPAYYLKTEQNWSWPGGVSGPTCAVGYDCGYVTEAELRADWSGIVTDATIASMLKGVGLKGTPAKAFVAAHRHEISITWDQATAEFTKAEVPKWLVRCRAVLPNFDDLPGDCQGALFSLTYNRGTGGYDDPGSRYLEMREIKAAMIAKNFAAIPAYIESMARIWPPSTSDLARRRVHEAALFRQGLATEKVAV
jgi:GH24 family phage-related lysozyme (muramidase)